MSYIVFGGGCFWGVEAYFKQVNGVTKTTVGYTGGNVDFPTYEEVSSGRTNHAEVIKIEYEEKKTSINTLLEHLFNIIDPTLVNQKEDDIGSQYRSGIYYTNSSQKLEVYNFIKSVKKFYKNKLKIEICSLQEFWEAEEFHQNYVNKFLKSIIYSLERMKLDIAILRRTTT